MSLIIAGKMGTLTALAIAAGSVALLSGGCNGSDSSGNTTVGTTGAVTGRVEIPNGGALPALTALVEGTSVSTVVQPTGSFTLAGVPAGPQTIEIVDSSHTPLATVGVNVLSGGSLALDPLSLPATVAASPGISGTVYYGPVLPVGQIGVPNDRPDPGATIRIEQPDGTLVSSVTSDQNGAFAVNNLAPGAYRIDPVSGNPFPRAAPFNVTVTAGQITTVVVNYDSGIR